MTSHSIFLNLPINLTSLLHDLTTCWLLPFGHKNLIVLLVGGVRNITSSKQV